MDQSSSSTQPGSQSGEIRAHAVDPNGLSRVLSPLSGVELVNALERAARRGKLPGYHKGESDVAFEIRDFGAPWESVLVARTHPVVEGGGGGCEITFSLRMKRGMAWVYALVLIATVWPGVWITDSMLRTYSSNYAGWDWRWTWGVYLVLTLPFVPWTMAAALRKSRQTARQEAGELIEKVRRLATLPAPAPSAANKG